ncbi:type II toxin-antitoxin system PrlF family antitoxin [Pseudescherichia vulneris]|uniref:type II toxin-antitoxin system PrlF family antitoxin n=1 Tax=Pseudescherichia vulneris TaxID=566 RepID=UPI00301A7F2C
MNLLTQAGVSLRASSKLTARSQTTIPASVRDAMKLKPGEEIEYAVLPDGQVLMCRKNSAENEDPVIGSFLQFLENDMQENPGRIKPLRASLLARAESLTADMDIDLDAPLTDEE